MIRQEKYTIIPAIIIAIGAFSFKIFEYLYFKHALDFEIYLAIIGVIFLITGIVIGLTFRKEKQSFRKSALNHNSIPLSKREHEVLVLIAQGYSNKEIADALFLSIPTIKSHTTSLYTKLDVQRRTQAVQKAKELKLLEQ